MPEAHHIHQIGHAGHEVDDRCSSGAAVLDHGPVGHAVRPLGNAELTGEVFIADHLNDPLYELSGVKEIIFLLIAYVLHERMLQIHENTHGHHIRENALPLHCPDGVGELRLIDRYIRAQARHGCVFHQLLDDAPALAVGRHIVIVFFIIRLQIPGELKDPFFQNGGSVPAQQVLDKMPQQILPLTDVCGLMGLFLQIHLALAGGLDDALSLPQVQKQGDVMLHEEVQHAVQIEEIKVVPVQIRRDRKFVREQVPDADVGDPQFLLQKQDVLLNFRIAHRRGLAEVHDTVDVFPSKRGMGGAHPDELRFCLFAGFQLDLFTDLLLDRLDFFLCELQALSGFQHLISVLQGRFAVGFFEMAVEDGGGREAVVQRNLRDGILGLAQVQRRILDPDVIEIRQIVFPHLFFKIMGEIGLRHMEIPGQVRQVQRFGGVQTDVIQDPVDFAQPLFGEELPDFARVNLIAFKEFLDNLKQDAAQSAQIRRVQLQILQH